MYDDKIEMAVSSQDRLAAVRSFYAFHDRELTRLAAEKRLFGEELARTRDPAKRTELAAAIRENRLQKLEHDRGWRSSSFRKRLKAGIENQVTMSKGAGPELRQLKLVHAQDILQFDPGESRADAEKQNKITGYAAVFGKDSVDLGGFIEQIAPLAFSEALKISDVKALLNHDGNLLFARTKSKSLRLYEDRKGLLFYADLIEGDNLSQSIFSRIARGDWSQCSFAFTTAEDKWVYAKRPGDKDLRTILKIKELFDISVVTYPAYPDTSASILQEDRAVSDEEIDRRRVELVKKHDREKRLCQVEARVKKHAREERLRQAEARVKKHELAKKRQIGIGYRKAGRVINRCRVA